MTSTTLTTRKESKPAPKPTIQNKPLVRKGVRGICGHIAKSANDYCGNPRCCPWGW